MTPTSGDRALTWAFLAPTLTRPTGGDLAMFEIANALARRGRDAVQVVHVPILGQRIRSLTDVPWYEFDPAVEHRFNADLDPDQLPGTDVVVHSAKLIASAVSPEGGEAGRRLITALQDDARRLGLPILLLQGHGVFTPAIEELALSLPGPTVCVGSWLADLAVRQGVPASDVVHIPNGVDPRRFRIIQPIGDRPPRAAMNFDPHPVKGGPAGIDALERLHAERAVPATVFGTRAPEAPWASGLELVLSPSQTTIVEEIYNHASLFLQPSRREGFGMCAVESMACGCALVTTANGGSADYAFDGETALVCGDGADEMAAALGRLAGDDALRVRIATGGARFVERFRWSITAERLAGVAAERVPRTEP